jgi:AraC-like DNA-binding protein
MDDIKEAVEYEPNPEIAMKFLSESSLVKNCVYCVDGEINSTPCKPNSEYALKHLLYIQSFSLIKASKFYFTKREGADTYALIYTCGGAGYVEYDGNVYHLRTGDGILIDCKKTHLYKADEHVWEHCVLHFNGLRVAHIYELFNENNDASFHETQNSDFHNALKTLIYTYSSLLPYWELQISSQLESLLVKIMTNTERYQETVNTLPETLKYLVRYMESNFEKPLTIEYLAEFSGFSKFYLSRLFKKHLNTTPNEYLIQLRINEAKRILKASNLPSNKICKMVGIEDENYFYRLFRKKVGVTPNQYRRS